MIERTRWASFFELIFQNSCDGSDEEYAFGPLCSVGYVIIPCNAVEFDGKTLPNAMQKT